MSQFGNSTISTNGYLSYLTGFTLAICCKYFATIVLLVFIFIIVILNIWTFWIIDKYCFYLAYRIKIINSMYYLHNFFFVLNKNIISTLIKQETPCLTKDFKFAFVAFVTLVWEILGDEGIHVFCTNRRLRATSCPTFFEGDKEFAVFVCSKYENTLLIFIIQNSPRKLIQSDDFLHND